MKQDIKKNIVNYGLNISIILITGACLYFAYSLIMGTSGFKSRGDLKEGTDTAKKQITNQPNLSIQIDILNATGENRIAARFRDYLKQKGFDVVDMGNYKTEVEKTLVVDKCGDISKAKRVAEALGVSQRNVVQQLDKSKFIDASIVIGKDYNELRPFQEKVKK
ncbi:MAG: LytR C-terminal domain-containing protein [Ignavibacteria bacterium]|nr:LytR C-terminal domain-containing protein [Ignavibacteria bacterium]